MMISCARCAILALLLVGSASAQDNGAAERYLSPAVQAPRTPPVLAISPRDGLLDEPRRITIGNLQPGELVRVTTRTERGGKRIWKSEVAYVAAADGTVDLDRDRPVSGDHGEASAAALLWSQKVVGDTSREVFPEDVLLPLNTDVRVETLHGAQAATLVQRLAAHGVVRKEVRERGLVGTLFLPPGHGPHPAVVVLNGSGGGINEPRAALYASRGYAALALGYFKAPGLSDYISNTPLEYFETALDWVRDTVAPRDGFVAVSGQSRGGELVLLLGSVFPQKVSAVIGYVPGAVVHGGQAAHDPAVGRNGPAWLLDGKPLPHIWENNRTATWAAREEGRRNAHSIITALQDRTAFERARIRVEDIQAPVLLISGSDDAAWPSTFYSQLVKLQLERANHAWPVEHLDYEGAGHSILLPWIPATYTNDGTPAANARANEESWRGVLKFLTAATAR